MLGPIMLAVVFAGIVGAAIYERRAARHRAYLRVTAEVKVQYLELTRKIGEQLAPAFASFGISVADAADAFAGLTVALDVTPELEREHAEWTADKMSDPQR